MKDLFIAHCVLDALVLLPILFLLIGVALFSWPSLLCLVNSYS